MPTTDYVIVNDKDPRIPPRYYKGIGLGKDDTTEVIAEAQHLHGLNEAIDAFKSLGDRPTLYMLGWRIVPR